MAHLTVVLKILKEKREGLDMQTLQQFGSENAEVKECEYCNDHM